MSGANVFVRLNYDFDSSKFEEAIELPNTALNFLENYPQTLFTWQKQEIANGDFVRTDYYKNPTINVISQLWDNVNSFYQTYNTIVQFDTTNSNTDNIRIVTAELSSNQCYLFRRHTDNVSGVVLSSPTIEGNETNVIDYPDYQKAISTGQQLLIILNETDELANTLPLLGSLRCLFTNADIEQITATINADTQIVNTSLRTVSSGDPPEDIIVSNLTSTQINTIFEHANTANNLIYKNRVDDWFFYRTSLKIINDFYVIGNLTKIGKTQRYLIDNLIGTENYLNKLAANN